MASADENLKVDTRVSLHFFQQPVKQAIFGARSGEDADLARHLCEVSREARRTRQVDQRPLDRLGHG
jgi:hypothetical protein